MRTSNSAEGLFEPGFYNSWFMKVGPTSNGRFEWHRRKMISCFPGKGGPVWTESERRFLQLVGSWGWALVRWISIQRSMRISTQRSIQKHFSSAWQPGSQDKDGMISMTVEMMKNSNQIKKIIEFQMRWWFQVSPCNLFLDGVRRRALGIPRTWPDPLGLVWSQSYVHFSSAAHEPHSLRPDTSLSFRKMEIVTLAMLGLFSQFTMEIYTK